MNEIIICTLLYIRVASTEYTGILINGAFGGTQLYDPFNSPHTVGNMHLGLQFGRGALQGAAAIHGPLAYFSGGEAGTHL